MNRPDLGNTQWRRSSYSSANSDCVEVAFTNGSVVGMRDSKAPESGQLAVPRSSWAALRRVLCAARMGA